MKILSLKISNFQKVRCLEIENPDGKNIVLKGENGVGKSSVINAIWSCIQGHAAMRKIPVPITQGEEHGEIEIDFGEYKVRRIFTAESSRIIVSNSEGFKGSQDIFKKFIGDLSPFDISEFYIAREQDQVAMLLKAFNVDINIADLNRERGNFYAQRTERNREVKRLETVVQELKGKIKEVESEQAVQTKISNYKGIQSTLINLNHEYITSQSFLKRSQDILAGIETEREVLSREYTKKLEDLAKEYDWKGKKVGEKADTAKRDVNEHTKMIETIKARLPQLEQEQQNSEKLEDLEKALEESRTQVKIQSDLSIYTDELTRRTKESTDLTAKIDGIDEKKKSALSKIESIPGIGITDHGIEINEIPLKNESDGNKIRFAMELAVKSNPNFNVIALRNGSLIGPKNMQIIREIAKEYNQQLILELVTDQEELKVEIE